MKVNASVKRMCRKCKIIKRKGVVRVICEDPRHKHPGRDPRSSQRRSSQQASSRLIQFKEFRILRSRIPMSNAN